MPEVEGMVSACQQLYRLERQESFSRVPAANFERDVLPQFSIAANASVEEIIKGNWRSRVYFVQTDDARFMLKSADPSLAVTLEAQSAMASAVAVGVIKPLTNQCGTFVASHGQRVWTAYPAIDGSTYDGGNLRASDAVSAGLDLLENLRSMRAVPGLPEWKHRPERWSACVEVLSDPTAARAALADSGCLISEHTLLLLQRQADRLGELTFRATRLASNLMPAVVHNDLQHANLIVSSNGPVFIDLEDICVESPQVAAAHSVFKLYRHSIHTGVASRNAVRQDFSAFESHLESHPAWSGAQASAYEYILLRILSDVSEIFLAWHEQRDNSDLYDLEKRLHNLLEAIDLFGAPLSWT